MNNLKKSKPMKQLQIKKHFGVAKSNSPSYITNSNSNLLPNSSIAKTLNSSILNTNIYCINEVNLKKRNNTKEATSSSKTQNKSFKGNTPNRKLNNKKSPKEKSKASPFNQRLMSYLKHERGDKPQLTLEESQKRFFDKVYPMEKGMDEMIEDIVDSDRNCPKDMNRLFFTFEENSSNCILGDNDRLNSDLIKIILKEYISRGGIEYWSESFFKGDNLTQWICAISHQVEGVSDQDQPQLQHKGFITSLTELNELFSIRKKTGSYDLLGLIFSVTITKGKTILFSFIHASSPQALDLIMKYIKEQEKLKINSLTSYLISICSSQQKLNELTAIYELHQGEKTEPFRLNHSKQLQTAKKAKNTSKLSSYLSVNDSKDINKQLTDLLAENKELRIEISNLKIQLASYKSLQQQISSIPTITYDSLSKQLQAENAFLMNVNLELNHTYHSLFEKVSFLSQELLNAESNVYTFDDKGNIFQSNESTVSSNNRKFYKQFKKSFTFFFSSLINEEKEKKSSSSNDRIFFDSFKAILNSYYCFMDTIIDDFELNKASLTLYQKYVQSSFLGVFYERIIKELLNHCLYTYKRYKLYESLNDMLIKLINCLLSSSFQEVLAEVEAIKANLYRFDSIVEENITNNKQIWLNEVSSYKKLFSFQSKSTMNSSNEICKELIENNCHDTCSVDLKRSDTKKSNSTFFGYIKNDESPSMVFEDEDSQFKD